MIPGILGSNRASGEALGRELGNEHQIGRHPDQTTVHVLSQENLSTNPAVPGSNGAREQVQLWTS